MSYVRVDRFCLCGIVWATDTKFLPQSESDQYFLPTAESRRSSQVYNGCLEFQRAEYAIFDGWRFYEHMQKVEFN